MNAKKLWKAAWREARLVIQMGRYKYVSDLNKYSRQADYCLSVREISSFEKLLMGY